MVYSPEIKSDPGLFELRNKFSLWKTFQLFLKMLNVHSPTIPLLKIYPREMKNCIPLQNLYVNIYGGFIHNCQKLKTATQISISLWMLLISTHGTCIQ